MMRHLHMRRTRMIVVILLALFGILNFAQSVKAQEAFQGDTIPASETVADDVLLNGDEVRLDGTVEGDVFAVGRTIVINGIVTGSLFAIAENITINGTVEGSVYSLAVSLRLSANGTIGRSLYFIGVSLLTERDSVITQDLNGVSLGAVLRGSVGRDTNAVIGLIEIARLILDGFARASTGKPTSGNLFRTRDALAAGQTENSLMLASAQATMPRLQIDANETAEAAANLLGQYLRALVSFLLVGGLAVWLIPDRFQRWADQVRGRPLPSAGYGLVAFIVGFVAVGILLILFVIIGAALGFVSLWGLAFTWWGISLSGLGLAFWVFILFVFYVSKAIVAYLAGCLILERVTTRTLTRKLWPLLLGLIIYVAICMVPYLGVAVGFVVTILGLGAVWKVWSQRNALPAANA